MSWTRPHRGLNKFYMEKAEHCYLIIIANYEFTSSSKLKSNPLQDLYLFCRYKYSALFILTRHQANRASPNISSLHDRRPLFFPMSFQRKNMEPMGAVSEAEWGTLSGVQTAEEADFMAQWLNSSSIPNAVNGGSSLGVPSTFWPCHDSTMHMAGLTESSCISLDFTSSRFYSLSQGSSSYSGGSLSKQSCYLSDSQPILTSNNSMSMDSISYLVDGDDCANQELSEGNAEDSAGNIPEAVLPDKDLQLKGETDIPKPDSISELKRGKASENSKKRSLSSGSVSKIINFPP